MRFALGLAAVGLAAGAVSAEPAKVAPDKYVTTATGLKYAVLKEGDGAVAVNLQEVSVHYTGWLQNGTKFDSSHDRKQPIEFVLGKRLVIPGWEEGLTGMKVGEQRQLVIPPKLAYGERDRGPIPANSTLVFDVELVALGLIADPEQKPEKVSAAKLKTAESGLKHAVLKEGDGEAAKSHDRVTVHYIGWLEDGKRFDSSLDHGRPFSFELGHGMVIPGWEEGVIGMKVGERRQLIIPAKLAYGETGTPGGPIPPNATLTFEVVLKRIDSERHEH
jgi:peptidylprolyl isomerase